MPLPLSDSRTFAAWNISLSAMAGARIWIPTGIPSSPKPKGTDIAGCPARLEGIVHTSCKYICMGSAVLSPNGKAVVGAVGLIRMSNFS